VVNQEAFFSDHYLGGVKTFVTRVYVNFTGKVVWYRGENRCYSLCPVLGSGATNPNNLPSQVGETLPSTTVGY